MADLLFVNIDHPVQASNSKARRLVRSHISRRQHEQKRIALELALKRGLEKQLQTQDIGDVAGPSRHDSSASTPSFGGNNASAGSFDCNTKAESTATSESVTLSEPDSNFIRPIGTVSNIPDRVHQSSGIRHDNKRPSYPLPIANSTQLPINYQQHPPMPLIQQNTNKISVALKRERDLVEEVEDYVESTPQLTSITTTRPNSRHPSQPVLHKLAKSSPTPQIRYSLIDPSDELQAFAREVGISVPPLLQHFYKVIDIMASVSEPQHNLPTGYMHALWDTSSRIDPAARAAVLFGAAANVRVVQATAMKLSLLYVLRGYALKSIRTALDDPQRYASDAVLLAVTTVAQTEMLLGWQEDHEVHKRGLAQIRGVRGPTIAKVLDVLLSFTNTTTTPQIMEWSTSAIKE